MIYIFSISKNAFWAYILISGGLGGIQPDQLAEATALPTELNPRILASQFDAPGRKSTFMVEATRSIQLSYGPVFKNTKYNVILQKSAIFNPNQTLTFLSLNKDGLANLSKRRSDSLWLPSGCSLLCSVSIC